MTFPPHGRLAVWYFWYFAFIGAFLPYFALYLQSLGFSAGRIAVLMSLGQLMRLLAPLLWSWLADSGGQRVRIVVGATAAALASFSVVFLTDDFLGLLVGLSILHFFWSASLPLVEALTLGHLAGRTENYGRVRLWGSVGFILTVLGVGLLLDVAPIRSQLWVSWLLLAGTLISALTLTEVRMQGGHATGPIVDVLRQRKVIYLMASAMLMTAAHGTLYVFYSIHLVNQGYGKTLVGLLWTLGVAAEIFIFLWMPRISLRFSLRGILLACFAFAVLRFLLIGWAVAFVVVLVIAQLLHAMSFGAHHAATVAALNRWFAPSQQARAQALYGSVAYGAGGLGGALLAGWMWESLGAGLSFSASALLALGGLALVWHGVPAAAAAAPVR
ncbi:MAG: MFS transporter [Rhodocyclales bacterium]|nr:MFS transporter [Rhodocyclales bacterium]